MHLNRKWHFCNLGAWFDHIFRQIVPMTEKTLKNTNLLASRHIKRENASLPVDLRYYYLRHFVTGDARDHGKGKNERRNASRPFSPSRLPLLAHFIERETAGYEVESGRFRFALHHSQLFEKKSLLYAWSFCF